MSKHDKGIDASWRVVLSRKAGKQIVKLPPEIVDQVAALLTQLTLQGPIAPRWHHYSKLRGQKNTHHCHLNKGKPRYVAVWFVHEKQIQLMEVTYVGTHENAPY